MNERQKAHTACHEYADRLVDLSDDELPADAQGAVAAHVATCDGCRAELGRLNGSLTALRGGIVATQITNRPQQRQVRKLVLIGLGSTAAAIAFAVGIASLLKAPASGRGEGPENASITENRPPRGVPSPNDGHSPNTLTNGQGFESGSTVTADDAIRRIALLEQQARLETSLALMPDDPWYAEQRAANEELLSTFRKAATAAGTVDHSPNQTPDTKGTL